MTERRTLIIRADASSDIGTGHVLRCLALAQAWQDTGGTVRFACADLPEPLAERLRQEGIAIDAISGTGGSPEDLQQFAQLVERERAEAVVLDGYQFDQSWTDGFAELPVATLVVDDYGHLAAWRTDFVLNQNAGAAADAYRDRGDRTRLLLGPRWALVRRELRESDGRNRSRDGSVKTVLVTLGGSDPNNVTDTVVRALLQTTATTDEPVRIRVLTGSLNDRFESLQALTSGDDRFEILRSVRDMAAQYTWADLAIAAGGSSNWEMCCFGLPRVVIVIADNQRGVARELENAGAAFSAGAAAELTATGLAEQLVSVLSDREAIRSCGAAARRLVDGDGALRCCAALRDAAADEGSAEQLTLRLATTDDGDLLLRWRNDPLSRAASRNSDPIEPETHRSWLTRCLNDAERTLLIAECNGVPVGTVRIDAGPISELSWTVAPEARGRGIGRRMVQRAAESLEVPLRAVARVDNAASQRIAAAAGFRLERQDGDWLTFIREPAESHCSS